MSGVFNVGKSIGSKEKSSNKSLSTPVFSASIKIMWKIIPVTEKHRRKLLIFDDFEENSASGKVKIKNVKTDRIVVGYSWKSL